MPKTKVKKGVITVAGLGTRFLPATKAMPKEMLPVLDKPVVQYIVEEMAESGIKEIIFVTSPHKKAIKNHFERNYSLEKILKKNKKLNRIKPLVELSKKVRFRYVVQSKPLGNGHALLCAKRLVGNESFAFSDGDSIIDSKIPVVDQLLKVFYKYGSSVIGVQKITDKQAMTNYGNVYAKETGNRKQETGNRKFIRRSFSEGGQEIRVYQVERFVEKPSLKNVSPQGLIVGGMRYIFTKDIWPILEKQKAGRSGEIWLSDAANALAHEKPFFAYQYEGKYFDTGNKVALLKTAIHFAKKEGLI